MQRKEPVLVVKTEGTPEREWKVEGTHVPYLEYIIDVPLKRCKPRPPRGFIITGKRKNAAGDRWVFDVKRLTGLPERALIALLPSASRNRNPIFYLEG